MEGRGGRESKQTNESRGDATRRISRVYTDRLITIDLSALIARNADREESRTFQCKRH